MKNILITGGSGTVGSAFIKHYKHQYNISIYSRNESLQHQIRMQFPGVNCILGEVENKESLFRAYDKIRPHIVIHAAALKHVDVAEKQPLQAVYMNIVGSLNVISATTYFRTPITVAISTDKACNHQNFYGMTKYVMEKCMLNANSDETKYAVTRFANVAHSNGSVIPLWLKMKAQNKPLKVTDPSMNRMIFSPTEAANLVQKAISLCEDDRGGFILTKLMKRVNLLDLAKAISDDYEVVGARPGEKIDEDLISEQELKYTNLLEDNYIAIADYLTDGDHLTVPLNTKTAFSMNKEELKQLVFG